METDLPSLQSSDIVENPPSLDPSENVDCNTTSPEDPSKRRLSSNCEENDADSTIHGFNTSNITVIEKISPGKLSNSPDKLSIEPGNQAACEGSDSGVEVVENCTYMRALSANSANSQDYGPLTPAQSCDSSIISCCSNYEEAYSILVRRNSTLLEDYTLRNGGCTSENGSESSSVNGSGSSRNSKRLGPGGTKKRTSVSDVHNRNVTLRDRSKVKPPTTPRIKSNERTPNRTTSSSVQKNSLSKKTSTNSLDLKLSSKKDTTKKAAPARTPSSTRSTTITPTDDGRWPSVDSKPAPLMSRSLRGMLDTPPAKPKTAQLETKTIEKYATLPRRKKVETADVSSSKITPKRETSSRVTSRDNSVNRVSITKKPKESITVRPSLLNSKRKYKVKIYHENGVQTALTMSDVDKALTGLPVSPVDPTSKEKYNKEVQADLHLKDIENLQNQLRESNEKYERLNSVHKKQTEQLKETETRLFEQEVEKKGLQEELRLNKERVLAILGGESNEGENASSDSLMMLESRFQTVSQVVIKQEEEISTLNAICRSLQLDLEKSVTEQRAIIQQQKDLEAESTELQEFMQAEKTTLTEALKEAESEIQRYDKLLKQKEKDVEDRQEECKYLVRLNEQRRQENLGIQARLVAMESKSRELLVHQGSSVSGASVAINALINRLDGLVEELVTSYEISEQELEDIIFHNEAYSNSSSSPDITPDKIRKFYSDRSPSPKKGSSFVSAVINAIKNAAAQSPFAALRDSSKDAIGNENSSSNEMLDSETEPCLMMEHVLEDVIVPDGHSHNMISSGHGLRLSHSESLKDLSQAILNRQKSERQASMSYTGSLNTSFSSDVASVTELFPSFSLVDQVIDVDNLVTRLLKVIRIIQIDSEEFMNELHEERNSLSEQVSKQKETNKVVVKQLKDWEVLGARLKTEVRELMQQLSKKNTEIDKIKTELNSHREQVEKLNQDVCELSTALAKAELEAKEKEEEVTEVIKNWEKAGESATPDVLGRLILAQNEIPSIKEKLAEKEKHLSELTQEFLTSKQVLSESLKEAVNEAKSHYDAIDKTLEVLHNIQSVVQQCPSLAQLQRELEEISFKTASMNQPDFNANKALLQAMANLEIAAPINTTA